VSSTVRHRLLVAYDVRDPVRLRRTHAVMLGYGDPLQYSVFLCDLSATERALMELAILKVVQPSVDSVIVVDLGPSTGIADRRIRTIGTATLPARERYHIV
jgi:CRISPR-associated protein Cas2